VLTSVWYAAYHVRCRSLLPCERTLADDVVETVHCQSHKYVHDFKLW